MIKTQIQLYWQAHKQIADGNNHFLEMIKCPTNPLTKTDLRALIKRNPNTWEKFKGFLDINCMVN